MTVPLDARFQIAPALEEYYVDKDTGLPLADGIITFYADDDRSLLKPVYEYDSISGYNPLPNPSILSAVGTFQDGSGNNIIPYYFPFAGTPNNSNGEIELYYITVQNSGGVLQFTREAWPNFTGSGNSGGIDITNFIPNGQFLAHNTTFPTSSSVTQQVSSIAQGGWFFVTNSTPTGTYTITYEQLLGEIAGINDFPRYAVIINCSSRGSDTVQALRIQWPDVNKFASPNLSAPQQYTFFFNAQTTDGGTYTVNLVRVRNYGTGGSPSPEQDDVVGTFTITPSWQQQLLSFNFSNNDAFTIGTNNNDIVALDLRPTGAGGFKIAYTDFALVEGVVALTAFPTQTNAEMLSEGVAGWMPTPDYLGNDLYCPLVLTQQGMIFDHSGIGKISATIANPVNNELLCNGQSLLVAGYSPLGIPYSRLFNTLFDSANNFIVTGAGASFIQSTANTGAFAQLYLTQNTLGNITHPSDSGGGTATGFTFRSGANGGATFNYTAYSNSGGYVVAISNFTNGTNGSAVFTDGSGGNATTMTFTLLSSQLGTCFYKTLIKTVAASTLANTGSSGKYFKFSDHSTNYYMWFFLTNETDPAPGGTDIRCDIDPNMLAGDVAMAIATRLNDAQIDFITFNAGSTVTGGDYFTFSANPPTPQVYVVWYKVNNAGTQPVVAGSPIYLLVNILSSDIANAVAFKTQTALSTYQFALPDLQGVFLRGNDPNSFWDIDVATRWSALGTIAGASPGTFEFDILQSHLHTAVTTLISGGNTAGNGNTWCAATAGASQTSLDTQTVIALTGGTETRPVNYAVNYVIKY